MSSSAETDGIDCLPDALLLVIFDSIADVKSLGRCAAVSRRFSGLVRQVQNVAVRVDCVVPDVEDSISSSAAVKSCDGGAFSQLFGTAFGRLFRPLQTLGQFLRRKRARLSDDDEVEATHHSPAEVLKNFCEVKFLEIELPIGELGIHDGWFLKWRATFGSTLENCVILGASSVSYPSSEERMDSQAAIGDIGDDIGVIPESFYTNGDLKLRVVWTISSLIAASARHYLVHPIIEEHKTLDRLVLNDPNGQGVLSMNREQLEELRMKPASVSPSSKRTIVPCMNMRLWYAAQLELANGAVLKGATLVAIQPSSKQVSSKESILDGSWVSGALEEPYAGAARTLLKGRTYCVQMNSF